jgi:hypothetical protein
VDIGDLDRARSTDQLSAAIQEVQVRRRHFHIELTVVSQLLKRQTTALLLENNKIVTLMVCISSRPMYTPL